MRVAPRLIQTPFDRADWTSRVVILDRLLAEELFVSVSESVGRTILLLDTQLTVVGVVDAVRRYSLATPPLPMLYVPIEQFASPFLAVVAKVEDPGAAVAFRVAFQRAAADLRVFQILPLETWIERELVVPKAIAVLAGVLGLLGLTIALMGVSTSAILAAMEKRREYGIRLALGASRMDIVRLSMRTGLAIAATGSLLGAILWFWTGAVVSAAVSDVQVPDPALVVAAAGICAIVMIISWFIPVNRLSRFDPADVIRTG